MQKEKASEWKVYFEGNFWGHSGRDRAGMEIAVEKTFQWAGRDWRIPAVYSCGRGLVADFCIRTEPEEIRAFIERWNLEPENDREAKFTREEEMRMEAENPLTFDFSPRILANGQELLRVGGCSVCFVPWLQKESQRETGRLIEHYGLDTHAGWIMWRYSFLWKTKRRPGLRSLFAELRKDPVPVPVCRICVSGPGERISFRCPESREDYVLSVVEYKKERLSENTFCPSGYAQFPTQFYQMKYTITPDIPADRVRISDCSGGDSPVRKEAGSVSKFAGAAAVGIIGGADGPCVAAVEDDERVKIRTAVSSLYYELPEKTEWAVTVYRKQYEDFNLTLI